jgi:hypothetical protein
MLIIDTYRSNNSFRFEKRPRVATRWSTRFLVFAQNLLQTMAGGL